MPERRVCLCVVFNHPYARNIPLLRAIYEGRFDHIRFLVPLERMSDPDVITVYRGSFYHNAYVTDALSALLPIDCSHYLFVHDDVLLSPRLTEWNMLDALGVGGENDGFIPHVEPTSKDVGRWGHWLGPLWRLIHPRNFLSGTGVDSLHTVLNQLPPAEVALQKMKPFGATLPTRLTFSERTLLPQTDLASFRYLGAPTSQDETLKRAVLEGLFGGPSGEIDIPYPFIVAGPSADFCVIPKASISEFAHISGVLAAAGVFVEIAYPTALALAVDRLHLARETGLTFLWPATPIAFQSTLETMIQDESLISAHPFKMSTVLNQSAMVDQIREEAKALAKWRPGEGLEARVRRIVPNFDAEDYLRQNPDVAASDFSAIEHFWLYGRFEARAGVPIQESV